MEWLSKYSSTLSRMSYLFCMRLEMIRNQMIQQFWLMIAHTLKMCTSRKMISNISVMGLSYGVNATFNNISVIPWQSILLIEETGVPEENHRTAVSHWQSCIVYTSLFVGFKLISLVVIGTDWIGSCKSNYYTITTTMAPHTTYLYIEKKIIRFLMCKP